MKCAVTGTPYRVFGYKGKQVRDNIHSLDLVEALWQVFQAPRSGEIYNMGGSRHCNCSVLEAITLCEELAGREMQWTLEDTNRVGDHIWYVSDVRRFKSHYPNWKFTYDLKSILQEIRDGVLDRFESVNDPRLFKLTAAGH